MPARTAQRQARSASAGSRRRRRGSGRERLWERDWELAALDQCLEVSRQGVGAMIVVDAAAGLGKSQLLVAAGDMARAARMRVLAGACAPLEREYPFGLATQLFEPLWLAAGPEEREAMLSGPAQLAEALLPEGDGIDPAAARTAQYPVIHGLFWTLRNLIELRSREHGEGIAIIVDDVQWADAFSLRFLAYLAERSAELPVAMVLARRAGEPSADPDALAALGRTAGGRVLRPVPLTAGGVGQVVGERFPDPSPEFCAAAEARSAGNPFLLTELVAEAARLELAPTARGAAVLSEVVPERVQATVHERLTALPAAQRAVAQALAVLGRDAEVREVAILTELETTTVLSAADALAERQILQRRVPLAYREPLLCAAVLSGLAPLQRTGAHLRAARALGARQAGAEEVADHLLLAPPDDDPAAVATLREAAIAARHRGERERASALLERALAESPDARVRAVLEGELAVERGQNHYAGGRFREAATAFAAGLASLQGVTEPQLTLRLRCAHLAAAVQVGELARDALAARDALIANRPEPLPGIVRSALAHTVVLDALHQTPRQQLDVLAATAWGDGELLAADDDATFAPVLLAAGLVIADRLELALEILDRAGAGQSRAARAETNDGPGRGSHAVAAALGACVKAWALYEQGCIPAALACAAAVGDGTDPLALTAAGIRAACHLERGEVAEAEALLERVVTHAAPASMPLAVALYVRGHLRLAGHRPDQSLIDFPAAGAILESLFPSASPGALPWRSAAALAHLAVGESETARSLAEQELACSERAGLTRTVLRNLRILGLALNGKGGGIQKLARAATIGRAEPIRLEYIRAVIDYGAALRRANRRCDAREPLRLGLELAHRAGATELETRAGVELVATGARPRRPEVTGINSLTPGQLRVAELAARGLTTRQISEALFVTPKTVEFHLRQTYRKLDVASREALTELMQAAEPPPSRQAA